MANYPRSLILHDGSTFHITWKCHNDKFLLKSEFSKECYYDLLLKYKNKYKVKFFSYCFMDNHPHLTGTCETQKGLSDLFRVVNSCFSKTLNKHLKRKGQTVMDRFKSPLIQDDEGLREVMFYNDLNPFRTIKQILPKDFKWSSYHHYAYGKEDPLLSEPEFYLEWGKTPEERQKVYREMVEAILKDDWHEAKVKDNNKEKRAKKRNYSTIYFIGDPKWVKIKYDKIRKRMASIKQKRREKNKLKS